MAKGLVYGALVGGMMSLSAFAAPPKSMERLVISPYDPTPSFCEPRRAKLWSDEGAKATLDALVKKSKTGSNEDIMRLGNFAYEASMCGEFSTGRKEALKNIAFASYGEALKRIDPSVCGAYVEGKSNVIFKDLSRDEQMRFIAAQRLATIAQQDFTHAKDDKSRAHSYLFAIENLAYANLCFPPYGPEVKERLEQLNRMLEKSKNKGRKPGRNTDQKKTLVRLSEHRNAL